MESSAIVDRVTPEAHADASGKRNKRILSASLSGIAGKGLALLVNAAIVPIAVRSLGPEQYGILVTITTTVTMILVMDLGIANTLTNLISEAYTLGDRELAGKYFTTAFWTVVAIMAALAIAGAVAWPYIQWQPLFHLNSPAIAAEVAKSFAIAFGICLLAIPANLAARIMAGYQELHTANLFTAAGSVLSLIAIAILAYLHGNLPSLVAAFAGGPVAANLLCLAWICSSHKPWLTPRFRHFHQPYFRKIFHSGGLFFITQIAALVMMNLDNLIISHYRSPAEVTPYNVTWRLTNYGSSLLSLINPALWPAYAEAYCRADVAWIRKAYRRTQATTVALLSLIAVLLFFIGKPIIKIWAGSPAIPSTSLLALMCVWMVIYAVSMNQGSLLGATGRVKTQAIGATLAAIVNLAASIIWVRTMGVTGVILATVLSYLIFVVSVQGFEAKRILSGRFLPNR